MKLTASRWLALALIPHSLEPLRGAEPAPPSSPATATPAQVTPGTVSATAAGREIRAVSPDPVSINTSGADATVNLGKHVLQIGKARLQFDEQMPSDIPAATRLVEIQVSDQMLTVRADGTEVLRAKLEDK